MNSNLLLGTLMGALVLVVLLLDLVNLLATVPFGRKRVLDTFQHRGFVLAGVVLSFAAFGRWQTSAS